MSKNIECCSWSAWSGEDMCRNYTYCWCFHFPRIPLHSIVKAKPRAKWIKRRGMRSNASHLTLVCPFALTPPPPRSPGHSWAAPTGVLSVTCQTNRAARFSELCWDLGAESLSCLPRHKQPRSGVGGKNDMKPGVADPWFHKQFTESWVSGQLVNSSLPRRAPAWARIHERPLQVQHVRQMWSKNWHPAVIPRPRTPLCLFAHEKQNFPDVKFTHNLTHTRGNTRRERRGVLIWFLWLLSTQIRSDSF